MKTLTQILTAFFVLGFWLIPNKGLAADAVCVGIQVEIDQTLTLERQAFDAKMTVKNGLPDQSLQNVSATLNFLDANQLPVLVTTFPDTEGAKFFYKTTSSAVTSIGAKSSAKLTWQIIPSVGAAGPNPLGTLYYIGATLKYTVNGVDQEVDVK